MNHRAYQLMLACIASAWTVTAFAQSDLPSSCRKTESVCVEGPETRDVSGAQIHKECWRYEHKFECVEESFVDTCAPLKAATVCTQTGSVCKTRAFNGECLVHTNTFNCSAKQEPLPPWVLPVGESYTITRDEIDRSQCQALQDNPRCQKTTSVCVEPGGTRIINGQAVTKDCWAWQETYACVTIQNDCQTLSQNTNCTLVAEKCEAPNEDGTCALKALTYKCKTGTTGGSEITTCNGGQLCINGVCFEQTPGTDQNFAAAMALMEAGRQAAGYAEGEDLVKFFEGESKACTKNALNSCCKTDTKGANKSNGAMISTVMQAGRQAFGSWYVYDGMMSGKADALSALYFKFMQGSEISFDWSSFTSGFSYYGVGFNPGVLASGGNPFTFSPAGFAIAVAIKIISDMMSCTQDEAVLSMMRGQGLCTYVDTQCTQKVLGSCTERSSTYCCFNAKLARIIQEQGREQLGMTFGTAQAPDCGGFTEAQFKQIDFSKIDLSEFIDDINANVQMPDTSTLAEEQQKNINERIRNYFNQ